MPFHAPGSHPVAVKLTPRRVQEYNIQRILSEPTKAILDASDVGAGKTLITSEAATRAGWTRVLVVGIKDTFAQWAERLSLQSDGAIVMRRIDGTVKGKAAFAALLAGEDGYYFIGSQMLQAQDWTRVFPKDQNGRRIVKIVKATNQAVV